MGFYEYFVISVYVINTFLMFIYGFHYYLVVYLYHRYKKKSVLKLSDVAKTNEELPKVTIQLPIFNELYVSERLVRKVMEMDYPKNLFEVQVLDDSIDETQDILKKLVREYQEHGYDIKYIHRVNRVDQKAGALKDGMESASGEFIAIFDSDFLPPKDFLMKTVHHFEDPNIGMVQTRWGHINEDYSSLTKAQVLGIDGHFMLEQTTRSNYELWLNFNGTAGIWRKRCIYDGGNWSGDTLTEDLDLSYRCQLKGWRFIFLQNVISPAELPVEMTGFKGQQFRWAKGSIQCAIKLMWKMLIAPFPLKKKLEGVVHLSHYSVHPLMLFNILWMFPLLGVQHEFFNDYIFKGYPLATLIGMIFMLLGTMAPSFFFMYSQKQITGSWTKRLKWLPYLFLHGLGIAVHITIAFIEAIIGKKSTFIRTPKFNVGGNSDKWQAKKYVTPIGMVTYLELIAAMYAMLVTYYCFAYGVYISAFFPIAFSISFSYVAIVSIIQSVRRSKLSSKKDVVVES